jgi:hypothetical protein
VSLRRLTFRVVEAQAVALCPLIFGVAINMSVKGPCAKL